MYARSNEMRFEEGKIYRGTGMYSDRFLMPYHTSINARSWTRNPQFYAR